MFLACSFEVDDSLESLAIPLPSCDLLRCSLLGWCERGCAEEKKEENAKQVFLFSFFSSGSPGHVRAKKRRNDTGEKGEKRSRLSAL